MQQVKIFCSYAREDQDFVYRLKTHLSPLERLYPWDFWNDMEIDAGAEREQTIQEHLDTALIILLLISPDFLSSEYCYSKEMKRAMERHERNEVCVIPILLRPVARWKNMLFGNLQALPINEKPITDHYWKTEDHAFMHIAERIAQKIDTLTGKNESSPGSPHPTQDPAGMPFSPLLEPPLSFSPFAETLVKIVPDPNRVREHIKVYEQQTEAYQFLIHMIERYGVQEAILLQYSCHTSLDLLRKLLRKGAKVTTFIQHEDVSSNIGSQFQAQRIRDTTMNLRSELGDALLTTKKLKVYKYHAPSSISAIKLDNRMLCMGWYTYEETKRPSHKTYSNDTLELSAHDRAAVVVCRGQSDFQMLDEGFQMLEGGNAFQALGQTFSVLEKNYRKNAEVVVI